MVHILLADDHTIHRLGMVALISGLLDDVAIAQAASFDKVVQLVERQHYDLVVLDINIPGGNGLHMINVLSLRQHDIKILILTVNDERIYALHYLKAGAYGYLMKNAGEDEVKKAILSILRSEKYFGSSFIVDALSRFNQGLNDFYNPLLSLSAREVEVTEMLVRGSGIAEIARALNLEISTVSTYKTRIFQKLNVNNVVELVGIFNLRN